MKKRFCVCAVLVIVSVFCLYCEVGFAAMRNLLDDFRSAVSRRDLEAAQAVINEGINASDAVKSLLLYNPSDKDVSRRYYVEGRTVKTSCCVC